MTQIDDLPIEILENILCHISPYDDLKACRLVCQKWQLCCRGVVKKRNSLFHKALKSGVIEWWSPPVSSTCNSITQRYSHSACIHDCHMYVFGGCTTSNTTFNDLWKYNLGRNEWTRILTTGSYPSPKAYSTMVTWGDKLLLFGGWTHPSLYPLHQQWVLFNEFHIYDILANCWRQIFFENSPPPTAGHTATLHDNIIVFFGGLQKKDSASSSTNDLYCLNLLDNVWFTPLESEEKPMPRYGHSQIKIDERNILVLSGCGGSNKLYTDVWLLTLPNNPLNPTQMWEWEQIFVEGLENMPPLILYNPAIKINNYVLVMCSSDSQSNTANGRMHQLLVPGSVRMHAAYNRPPPPPPPRAQGIVPLNQEQREVNINGLRGAFRNSRQQELMQEGAEADNHAQRARPSVRPNASSDRHRMLQALSRLEDRIKSRKENNDGKKTTDKSAKLKSRNPIVPHLLNIEKVLTSKTASWLPVALDQSGHPPYLGFPPSSCLLYTLLSGRGHLIMFGGVPYDMNVNNQQQGITNRVSIISAPFSNVQNINS